jgi:hypothetical protein
MKGRYDEDKKPEEAMRISGEPKMVSDRGETPIEVETGYVPSIGRPKAGGYVPSAAVGNGGYKPKFEVKKLETVVQAPQK